jgi:hypothetical protein
MVLKKVGVLSCGKVLGTLYALLGLLIGAVVSIVAIVGAAIGSASGESPQAFLGLLFGIAAIVAMPLLYGGMGFVGGLISAALYNIIAGFVGGLEVELEELTERVPTQP